ncbi:hypothetical protein SAMN06265365_106163 [Tistlia consotensis]|uniref:Uncharacterized protein n=1 Tax=Tistlia consotensis USBA 355 TaxID=560819 RepID=A0A1Y6BE02_9PROT|nr:hypothetical protein [Tistlia consotensis]SMF04623.1 hypothetical protein SAMN05428998_103214 [Tistlia consotensis USBA 355]SNR54652.1 hypothetical protein SAMN06265365_106163 [Tistlia consotensis]
MAGPLSALPAVPPTALTPGFGPLKLPPDALACLPAHLHPVSRFFLERWIDGTLTTPEFLRWFHMPNSDYLEVGRCLLTALTGN